MAEMRRYSTLAQHALHERRHGVTVAIDALKPWNKTYGDG